MLTEEVTVVAQKNDERVVELSLSLQRFQDRAYAFVDGSHHRCAQSDLFLADIQRGKNGLRTRFAKLEHFGPGGFLLQYLGVGKHVGRPAEHASPVKVLVPVRDPVA